MYYFEINVFVFATVVVHGKMKLGVNVLCVVCMTGCYNVVMFYSFYEICCGYLDTHMFQILVNIVIPIQMVWVMW